MTQALGHFLSHCLHNIIIIIIIHKKTNVKVNVYLMTFYTTSDFFKFFNKTKQILYTSWINWNSWRTEGAEGLHDSQVNPSEEEEEEAAAAALFFAPAGHWGRPQRRGFTRAFQPPPCSNRIPQNTGANLQPTSSSCSIAVKWRLTEGASPGEGVLLRKWGKVGGGSSVPGVNEH